MNMKNLKSWKRNLAFSLATVMLIGSSMATQAATLNDVFDAEYYSAEYNDLSTAFGTDAVMLRNHYQEFGINEGRNATSLIDVKKYREAYPDLDAAFGDNWDAYLNHYLTFGFNEGRNSFGTFDARAYADRYPDLKAAFGYDVLALYNHYLQFGRSEGRNAGANVTVSSSRSSSSSSSSQSTPESGPVTTTGTLCDPETGAAVPNATITFTRVSDLFEELAEVTDTSVSGNDVSGSDVSGSDLIVGDGYYVVRTDENGQYVIPDFEPGVYSVTATAPNYMTLTMNSITISSHSGSFSMPTFELLSADMSGSNVVSGTAVDAATGVGLANVTLKIREGWNTTSGSVIATTTTDESGAYSISLARGYYTIEFCLDSYNSDFVNVASSNAVGVINGTLNSISEVTDTQCRIVLTWNEVPRDLDSHLVGASDTDCSGCFHVYFADKIAYDAAGNVEASLDVDDTSSYGPETVTVLDVDATNTYYYSVHDFTNGGNSESTEMSLSGANVKVYMGSSLVKEYNVPTNVAGYVWNVFKIENGRIIDINAYGSDYSSMYGEYTLDYECY